MVQHRLFSMELRPLCTAMFSQIARYWWVAGIDQKCTIWKYSSVWWLLNYFSDFIYLSVFLSVSVSVWLLYHHKATGSVWGVLCEVFTPAATPPPPHPVHLHHVSILQLCGWESTCLRLEICVNDSHLGQLMRPRVTSQEPLRCLAYLHSPSLFVLSDAVVGLGAAQT